MPDRPVYIIAEIGINHNGSLDNCLEMIDAAAAAGCNAAKFQHFKAKYLYPETAGKLDWKDAKGAYSYDIFDAAKRFEMPEAWITRLMRHCAAKKIDFLASVFDARGLRTMVRKGLKRIKIASYSLTNLPLLRECAKTKLPLIISTGGATLGEVEKAVFTVNRHHDKISLLHCSLKYPTPLKDCNLGVIDTLKLAFPGIAVGFSDHTAEASDAAAQAVYLGASIIEKHITLDRKMAGPDHFFALEPDEIEKMVKDVRSAETAYKRKNFTIDKLLYGTTAKVTFPHERYLRDFAFMSLFARRDIKKGRVIRPSHIAVLRPGKKAHGLAPEYMSLFEDHRVTAGMDIPSGEPITWADILR
ncbi:MAG: N-acetylneuraminate synthase family protein [Candidatus Omnitrophota bacterium]